MKAAAADCVISTGIVFSLERELGLQMRGRCNNWIWHLIAGHFSTVLFSGYLLCGLSCVQIIVVSLSAE